jgi:iron(III) transport system permease protein
LVVLLVLLAGVPLVAPVVELLRLPAGWNPYTEADRLGELAGNSLLLMVGTVLVALPLGVAGGALLFRTDLPGRRFWRFVLILIVFVPLPLTTTAWQMAIGPQGWLPLAGGAAQPGQAWSQGLLPAVWGHAMLALPWVVLLAGLGLTWVEPELEEDALLAAPAWRVFWAVTLPRAKPAILLAGLWAALLALNEITVTDIMKVRTYSEEVYTQFNSGGPAEAARAVAVALPAVGLAVAVTVLVVNRWRRDLPPRLVLVRPPRLFRLGRLRWPCFALVAAAGVVLVGVPLSALVWKAGLRYATAAAPGPPTWDAGLLAERWLDALAGQRRLLLNSLLMGLLSGSATGLLGLLVCWLARDSRHFERFVWGLAAALWAVPGPVLGVGLLAAMQGLFALPGGEVFKAVLWDRPSPLPNVWVWTLRFLPVALAMLWPIVRLIPRELDEAARVDGLGPGRRFARVILPLAALPLAWTVLGVAVLTLGELSASKLIWSPGFTPFAHHVFMQMHASADTELAALCLVLLVLVAIGAAAVARLAPALRRRLGRW